MLAWEIAEVLLAIDCGGGTSPDSWVELFPGFAVRDFAGRAPDVVLDVEPVPGWVNSRQCPKGEPGWPVRRSEDGYRLDGPDYAGVLRQESDALRGTLIADSDSPGSLAYALRAVLQRAIVGQGLLLHSSGVVRDGSLYLFAGYARAGKTTIALELNGGGVPFSLDRVVCIRGDGSVKAHPTPFSDTEGEVVRCMPATPEAVIVIAQGNAHSLCRLTPASGASALVHHSLVLHNELEDVAGALSVSGWIAERVPVYRMTFSRDVGFWTLIEGATDDVSAAFGG